MPISHSLILNAALRDAERASEFISTVEFSNQDLLNAKLITASEALTANAHFYLQTFN